MTDLVCYCLAAFGLAYIVGHAKISLFFRVLIGGTPSGGKPLIPVVGPFLVDLVECPACFGFWEGLAYGWITTNFVGGLWFGCLTSGSNFLLGRFTKLI